MRSTYFPDSNFSLREGERTRCASDGGHVWAVCELKGGRVRSALLSNGLYRIRRPLFQHLRHRLPNRLLDFEFFEIVLAVHLLDTLGHAARRSGVTEAWHGRD